ncbi:response regulator [Spirochaeta lutea]|uniref:Response regulatory domain-containing protein n=1 Tax=Spirochaeta lutea TaxID=1480694 RepID=A0A098QWE7_9SPIO|nr:response regulator [Spirochaeta lutea]KGE71733.1 hypothetical protein DC28_10855 [Spirochaeta lutea]
MKTPQLVLIAEDEAINRMFLVKIVERAGFSALEAQTGEEAIRVYERRGEEVGIILMDLSMPEKDGLEAARELRAQGVTTPILALTAHSSEEDRSLCLEAGMNEVLIKPVQIQAVQDALQRYLGSPAS